MRLAIAAEQNFSPEIFPAAKLIARSSLAAYELEDLYHTPIDGLIYRYELTPVLVTDRTA